MSETANGTPVGQPVFDLYKEAAVWGEQKALEDDRQIVRDKPASKQELVSRATALFEKVKYWTAWWAARRATDALLDEARRIGVTPEQWESLRAKAAEVAYD